MILREVSVALAVQAKLGECPRWDEKSQLLYWVDITDFQLHRFNPETGENNTLTFKEEIGCFSLRREKGFVLAMRSGFYLLDDWNTDLKFICDPELELKHNRFNDGRCDAKGRFIAGSYYPPKDHDAASLWSLSETHIATKLEKGLLTSNGAAFSPDNTVFYLADTPKHVIYRYDYDLDSGCISNRSVFHQFPFGGGRPDGAAVDVNGNYWAALYEGARIVCLNPRGDIIEEIIMPAKCPTMVAFGGKDLKTLYITTVGDRSNEERGLYPNAGSIFKVNVGIPGILEYRFVG